MKHILIFSLKSVCYNSFSCFAHSLFDALKAAGIDAEIFSSPQEPLEAMERLIGWSFDAVLDFNSELPRLLMEDGSYFLNQIDAPFYNILLDHPLYHHDTLKHEIPNFHALCPDENHAKYIKTRYPHIASANIFPMTGKEYAPHDDSYPEKTIDVLFSGTYTDYRKIEEAIASIPSFLGKLTKQLIALMLEDDSLTQEEALCLLMPSLEEAELIKETFPLHMQACFLCDGYLRAKKREHLLLHLAKENVPLTLCGNGFRKSPLAGFKNIRIIDDIPFSDTFALFYKSKITLNLLPEFKNGTHDRIYSSMLNHSLCLTDASPFLEKQFQGGRELCFYDPKDPNGLAGRIFHLLSSPEQLVEISQNGFGNAKENHSWQARAAYLMQLMP